MQFAVGRPGGADAAFKTLGLDAVSGVDKGVLSVDLKNAYGTVNRSAVQEAVRTRAPWMSSLVDRLLIKATRNAFDVSSGDAIWVNQITGV